MCAGSPINSPLLGSHLKHTLTFKALSRHTERALFSPPNSVIFMCGNDMNSGVLEIQANIQSTMVLAFLTLTHFEM